MENLKKKNYFLNIHFPNIENRDRAAALEDVSEDTLLERQLNTMYEDYLERIKSRKGKPIKVRVGRKNKMITVPDMEVDTDVIPSDKPGIYT